MLTETELLAMSHKLSSALLDTIARVTHDVPECDDKVYAIFEGLTDATARLVCCADYSSREDLYRIVCQYLADDIDRITSEEETPNEFNY